MTEVARNVQQIAHAHWHTEYAVGLGLSSVYTHSVYLALKLEPLTM